MKPETVSILTKLLNNAVNVKKAEMLRYIEGCINADKVIGEYQELYRASEDFNEWLEEQEDCDNG